MLVYEALDLGQVLKQQGPLLRSQGWITAIEVDDLIVASSLDDFAFTQHHIMVVQDLTVASDAEQSGVAVEDLAVAVAIDNIALGVALQVADLIVVCVMDDASLTTTLAVDDLTVASVIDVPAPKADTLLVVQDLSVVSAIEAVSSVVAIGGLTVTFTASRPEVAPMPV